MAVCVLARVNTAQLHTSHRTGTTETSLELRTDHVSPNGYPAARSIPLPGRSLCLRFRPRIAEYNNRDPRSTNPEDFGSQAAMVKRCFVPLAPFGGGGEAPKSGSKEIEPLNNVIIFFFVWSYVRVRNESVQRKMTPHHLVEFSNALSTWLPVKTAIPTTSR